MKKLFVLITTLVSISIHAAEEAPDMSLNILAFSKTTGFRHESIPNAIKAFAELAQDNHWNITFTEDGEFFEPAILDRMDVVIFLLNTGDVLNAAQRSAFKKFIQSGGGFVGVHSGGTVTESSWEWYQKMMAAEFTAHPPVCDGLLIIEDKDHPATRHFG
jgi:type 1 glutamine amidotransferase